MNLTEHNYLLPEHARLVAAVDLSTALEQEWRWRPKTCPADITLLQVCALRLSIEVKRLLVEIESFYKSREIIINDDKYNIRVLPEGGAEVIWLGPNVADKGIARRTGPNACDEAAPGNSL